MKQFDDERVEHYPQELAGPTVSRNALRDMDEAVSNFQSGRVGGPLDVAALAALADQGE